MPHTNNSNRLTLIAAELEQHIRSQLNLCDKLEAIADSLPNEILAHNCLQAAQQIYPTVKSAHIFEETLLFPILEHRSEMDANTTMDRLHCEHWTDEEYSQELSESLKDYVAGRDTNAEKLGYMLRGFFEGLRRHIAFERELIAPMLAQASKAS